MREASCAKGKGKQLREETLWWADWVVLVKTLFAKPWPDDIVLLLYLARWQIELIFKRMKTFLELHRLHIKHLERAQDQMHLLLILHEHEARQMREVVDGLLHQQAGSMQQRSGSGAVGSSPLSASRSYAITYGAAGPASAGSSAPRSCCASVGIADALVAIKKPISGPRSLSLPLLCGAWLKN